MATHRGKHIETGEWVYGYLIGTDVIVGEIVEWDDEYFCTEFWYKVDPKTVGREIGLPDRHGIEIHEGDIVKVDDGRYSGVVKFNHEDLSYGIEDKTGGYGFVNGQIYDERPEYRTYEIIGNIYETPELLKKEE